MSAQPEPVDDLLPDWMNPAMPATSDDPGNLADLLSGAPTRGFRSPPPQLPTPPRATEPARPEPTIDPTGVQRPLTVVTPPADSDVDVTDATRAAATTRRPRTRTRPDRPAARTKADTPPASSWHLTRLSLPSHVVTHLQHRKQASASLRWDRLVLGLVGQYDTDIVATFQAFHTEQANDRFLDEHAFRPGKRTKWPLKLRSSSWTKLQQYAEEVGAKYASWVVIAAVEADMRQRDDQSPDVP